MSPSDPLARGLASRPPATPTETGTREPQRFVAEPVAADPSVDLTEWRERCYRLAAEFENFKQRTARDSGRRAAELRDALVRDLLPALDNLERALAPGPQQSVTHLHEGVQITLRQLTRVLNEHGFFGRDDLGRPFDPRYHDAVCVRAEPARADASILEVWQRGWQRGQELFRPARVVVNDLAGDPTAGSPPRKQTRPATEP